MASQEPLYPEGYDINVPDMDVETGEGTGVQTPAPAAPKSELVCNDYGTSFKGCGAPLRWPTDAEKATGLKRPLNLDGSVHSHTGTTQTAKQYSGGKPVTNTSQTGGFNSNLKEILSLARGEMKRKDGTTSEVKFLTFSVNEKNQILLKASEGKNANGNYHYIAFQLTPAEEAQIALKLFGHSMLG